MSAATEHRAHDWLAAVTWRYGWSLALHLDAGSTGLLIVGQTSSPHRSHTRTVPAASVADPAAFYQWLVNTLKAIAAHEAMAEFKIAGRSVTSPPNDAVNARELAHAITDVVRLAGDADGARNRRRTIHEAAESAAVEFAKLTDKLDADNVTPPTETDYRVDGQDTPTREDTPEWQ